MNLQRAILLPIDQYWSSGKTEDCIFVQLWKVLGCFFLQRKRRRETEHAVRLQELIGFFEGTLNRDADVFEHVA